MNATRCKKWVAVVILTILSSVGCGTRDGIERVVVSGTVTYDDKPLQKGQIRFIPSEDSAGPITIEPVVDGFYTSEDVGGVPVGSHRVEILGYDPEVYENAPKGPGSRPVPQLLPKKYNHESELTALLEPGLKKVTLDYQLEP